MRKNFLTLQKKLMFTLLFAMVAFALILSYLYYSKNLREEKMEQKILSTNIKTIKSIVVAHISLQNNIVKDYAAWDDMFSSVQTKNLGWLKTYTESFLSTYGQSCLAVCDGAGNMLYRQPQNVKIFSLDIIQKLQGNYGEFYTLDGSIPVHVSWSIITTTVDTLRKCPGVGYLFVAKKWDSGFISELTASTGLQIFLSGSSQENTISRNDSLIKVSPLLDINGNAIATLYFEQDDFIAQIHRQGQILFISSLLGICIVFLVFWLLIRKIITRPVSILLKSLKTGNIAILEEIKTNSIDDEWTLAAHLLEENALNIQKLKDLMEIKDHLLEENALNVQKLKDLVKEKNELVATKDKFFDVIAHDLRSPFNAIVGFSEILADEKEKLSFEDQKLFASYILEASHNVSKLLNRLLEWARLQTGRWLPNPKLFSINKLVDSVVSFHQSNAAHNKITLLVDNKESINVCADEQMIEIALRNLISNAIKFTKPSGFVKIRLYQQDEEVVVVVSDNGVGMSLTLQNSLFKIGENVVVQDVSGKSGTGLGLILSQELITQNKGKIWFKSDPHKGTKFYFSLPLPS